jgi:MoaA/NifB/PqqE/SkfB family radical SAM enzyme
LLNEHMAAALVASGLDKMQVSLWASSREDYECNHPGTPATLFDKVVRGLEMVSSEKSAQGEKRPQVVLHYPLSRNTYQKLERFAALALSTGCDGISFSPWLTHRGTLNAHAVTAEEELALRRSLERLRTQLRGRALKHNIDEVLGRYDTGRAVWRSTPCYIGWIDARVKTDGSVVSCNACDLPMGNLHVSRLRDIWNEPAYRDFRRRTRTREGLEALGPSCDCEFCCHLPANRRLHCVFRVFAPLMRRRSSARSWHVAS